MQKWKVEFAVSCLYEMYKADWMRRISADEVIEEVVNFWYAFKDDEPMYANEYDFADWVEENGYSGTLYVCFDEFCGSELWDKEYMRDLCHNNDEIMECLDEYYKENGREELAV